MSERLTDERLAESVVNAAREMACEARAAGQPSPATIRALAQAVEDLDGGELRCPPDELSQCRATVKVLIRRERALLDEAAALRRAGDEMAEAAEEYRRAVTPRGWTDSSHTEWQHRADEALREALADWRRVRGE